MNQTFTKSGCQGFERTIRCSRRDFLRAGGLASFGLTLPQLLRAEAGRPKAPQPKAKSCILVYLFGGPPQLDTWDMKPDAPAEVRGEFQPRPTRVPGIAFCELLPRLSKAARHLMVIRSMTHDRNVHGGAVGFVLSGTRTEDPGIPGVRGPAPTIQDHPNLGSAVDFFRPSDRPVPSAVTLPYTMIDGQGQFVPGQRAGLLGRRFDPWFLEQDPNESGFRVDGLRLSADVPPDRLADRRRLLETVEQQQRTLEQHAETRLLREYTHQAVRLLTGSAAREAFRIDREPPSLRDRYGRNTFGQSCLLARRMVEAGVRFVQVNMGNRLSEGLGWDTHRKNFERLRDPLLPTFDAGFSTLIEDLAERGLLHETLVVCMGEFGRTPKISVGGRDHWPECYSLLLAGAGLCGGTIYGRSDSLAAKPVANPVTPEQLAATVYWTLGIDPEQELTDHQSRRLPLVRGEPLKQLWGVES